MLHNPKLIDQLEFRAAVGVLLCVASLAAVPEAVAGTGFTQACGNVRDFFDSVVTILRVISVAVVTVAIIFAGYQIAFAHKRLSDVAPVLIGGLLIGGAAALASWFTDWDTGLIRGASECPAASS